MTITRHSGSAYGVAASPDGRLLVSVGADGKLRVAEIATGAQLAAVHIGGTFNRTTAFSPDGQRVLGGCKTLSVFDAATAKKVATLKGHKHEVNAARFSPDGTRIATGSGENWTPADHSVRIWDAASGAEQRRIKLDGMVRGVEWLDDDTLVALAGRSVLRIDARTGDVAQRASLAFDSESMAVCRRTRLVLVAIEYGAGAVALREDGSTLELTVPWPGQVQRMTRSVAVAPTGRCYATAHTFRDYSKTPHETCVAVHWDAEGRELSRAEWHGDFLHSVTYSADGELLFTGDAKGEVRGWHTRDGSAYVPAAAPKPATATKPKSERRAKSSAPGAFVFGDAFGLTYVALGAKPKIKSTTKVAAPRGAVSWDDASKLALSDGRLQTGAYGDDGVALLNLPGLGLRAKLSGVEGPVVLLARAAATVARHEQNGLSIHEVEGDQLREVRRLSFEGARALEGRRVGPAYEGPSIPTRGALVVSPTGAFVSLAGGVLHAGRIDLEGERDEVFWSMPFALHPSVDKGLAVTDEKAWLTVMDHARSSAELLGVSRDGRAETHRVDALGLPAISEHHLLYQPTSDRIVRRAWSDGSEESFDVGAHNAHPAEPPEPQFYKGAPPPPPTRLVGEVRLAGERALFVPWHREHIVDLATNERFDRGLPPDCGPFRRGVLEILARDNEALAPLQMQVRLGGFEHGKHRQCPLQIAFDVCPPTFAHTLACSALGNITERFELRTHGIGWGSTGRSGGPYGQPAGPAGLEETRAALAWMRPADVVPLEVASVHEGYKRLLGIPFEPTPSARPFDERAERVWLRATLETMRAGGWIGVEPSEAWETTPVLIELAHAAADALPRSTRPTPYEGIHLLSCMLAHHFDRDALSPLLALMEGYEGMSWNLVRQAGELVVWLCHRHPDLKERALAGLREQEERGSWNDEKAMIREKLARGARHLWSNG